MSYRLNFLFLLLISSAIISCKGSHNAIFDCKGDGCFGAQSTPLEPSLSFLNTLEQGYWYSRYNLSDLSMKSGAGEQFMPDMNMVTKMVEMSSDQYSTATPPMGAALLKRVYNNANPTFLTKKDANDMDFSDERWTSFDLSATTGAAFGWTLIKEIEWSKLFNVDAHFGKPGEVNVPAAQQRFNGLVLCAEALVQADLFIDDYKNDKTKFDLSKPEYKYIAFQALSNLAAYLGSSSLPPVITENRCSMVAAMMKNKPADEIKTDLLNFLSDFEFDLEPANTIKERSLLIQAYSVYAKANKDTSLFNLSAIPLADQLLLTDGKNVVENAYKTRALIDAYRIGKDKSYLAGAVKSWEKIKADYNFTTGVFASLKNYETDDIAVIFSALNALKLFAGKEIVQYELLKTFISAFENLVNKSGLQISAPDISTIAPWERKANPVFHRAANIPTPDKANDTFGIASVFSAEITWNEGTKTWVAKKDLFDTAGAMHLSNQMVWFHHGEVSGFACPDEASCIPPNDINGDDLNPPGASNDDGSNTPIPVATFNTIHSQILTRCLACHSGSGAPHGLDMSTPDKAYGNLVGVASVEGSAFGGVLRVTPGNDSPAKSYIIAKLMVNREFRVGDRMPRGGPYLKENEIEMVKNWIKAGAKR